MAKRAGVPASSPITTPSLEARCLDADAERALRRSLGRTAWAVLDDLRLDAVRDGAGRPVVATSARRVAAHLGITKNTAARALRALSATGLVGRRPQGTSVAGRFAAGCYELLVPAAGAACRANRDTVAVVGARPTDHGRMGRRKGTTITSQSAQLSLLEPAAVDGAGNGDAR